MPGGIDRKRAQVIAELLGQFGNAGMLNPRTELAQELSENVFEPTFERAPDARLASMISGTLAEGLVPLSRLLGMSQHGTLTQDQSPSPPPSPPDPNTTALLRAVMALIGSAGMQQQQQPQRGPQSFSFPGNLDRRVRPFR